MYGASEFETWLKYDFLNAVQVWPLPPTVTVMYLGRLVFYIEIEKTEAVNKNE